jgi:hypothetical protein
VRWFVGLFTKRQRNPADPEARREPPLMRAAPSASGYVTSARRWGLAGLRTTRGRSFFVRFRTAISDEARYGTRATGPGYWRS